MKLRSSLFWIILSKSGFLALPGDFAFNQLCVHFCTGTQSEMHHYCQTKHTHSFPMKIPLGVCGKVLLINILPVSSFLHLTAFFSAIPRIRRSQRGGKGKHWQIKNVESGINHSSTGRGTFIDNWVYRLLLCCLIKLQWCQHFSLPQFCF